MSITDRNMLTKDEIQSLLRRRVVSLMLGIHGIGSVGGRVAALGLFHIRVVSLVVGIHSLIAGRLGGSFALVSATVVVRVGHLEC